MHSANSHYRTGSGQIHMLDEEKPKVKSTYKINYIRVHYFFSEENSISKFLSETEIKCRLTQGTDWNSFIAEGSSKTISHFKNRFEGGQRHSQQMLLFFEDATYCTLTLQVGLVCDKQYNTSKMNLYKYNDIYFPDDSYHNANEFPAEWMEMFEDIEPRIPIKDLNDQENQTSIEKYSPKCSQKELNQMIDFDSYKTKSKYSGVKSKISQQIEMHQQHLHHQKLSSQHYQQTHGSTDNLRQISLAYDAQSYQNQNNFTNLFPQTTANINTFKPPRAGTAQLKKTSSEFQIRPHSTKNATNPNSRIQSGILGSQRQAQLPPLRSAESYKLIMDRKQNLEELDLLREYENDGMSSGEDQEEIDLMNDSAEMIVREKLMQHFKQQYQMEDINFQEIE